MKRTDSSPHPPWSQDNPRDQLRALLSAIYGNVSNMKAGVGNPEVQIKRIEGFLEQCVTLAAGLPTGEWDPQPPKMIG